MSTDWTFDSPDNLNDDGSVTLTIVPSAWHAYNVSPDTYGLFTSDNWEENEIEWQSEETGRDLTWDDFDWSYDHKGIVSDIADMLADWIADTLRDECGLTSVRDVKVSDTWSPAYYNFTSDGFEVELTCDPAELRALTPAFDVDAYGNDVYRSYDGFASFVPNRLTDPRWRAQYDGEFRIETLLANNDPYRGQGWRDAVWDNDWEVYADRITYTVNPAPEEEDEKDEREVMLDKYADIPGQLTIDA